MEKGPQAAQVPRLVLIPHDVDRRCPSAPCLPLGQVAQQWPSAPAEPQMSATACESMQNPNDWQTNAGRGPDYAAEPNTAVCTAGKLYGTCFADIFDNGDGGLKSHVGLLGTLTWRMPCAF